MPRKSLEVAVEPSVLVWARKSAGYEAAEVSEILGFKKNEVGEWELGKEKPTLSKLEKLATKYKRPLAVFFLSKPPKEKPLPKDYRIIPGIKKTPLSPETRLAIRRASRLQFLAKDLMEGLGRKPISQLGAIERADPEAKAKEIRKILDVDIQEQFAWRHEYEALRMWRRKIESFGIFIFQLSMPEEIRGFSLTEDTLPVIVLNTKDAVNGRIFSLLHEYAHLLLNKGGMCNMEEVHLRSEDALTEQFCNHLAGAILVPKDNLLDHKLVTEFQGIDEWSDEILQEIAADFKVSKEVILRRLVLLERAERKFYKIKHEEWKAELQREKERRKEKIKEERFARDIPQECITQNGVPFISLVLEAHSQEKIGYTDVSDYLGIRLKHLPKIELLLKKQILF